MLGSEAIEAALVASTAPSADREFSDLMVLIV
jgi:hypothetical protein